MDVMISGVEFSHQARPTVGAGLVIDTLGQHVVSCVGDQGVKVLEIAFLLD